MKLGEVLFEVSLGKSVLAEREANLVEGPFADIQWGGLLGVAELNAKVFGAHFGFEAEDFHFRQAFRENGNCFSPCVRGYLSSDQKLPPDIVRQLLFSTASAITTKKNSQGGLFASNVLRELPSGPVSEFLSKNGGKRVFNDMVVTFQQEVVAQVSGAYAPRPADEVASPEARRAPVIVDDVCASGRSAVCRVVDNGAKGNKLSVNFSENFLRPLATALGCQSLVNIVYEESLDAKGLRFLNLCQVEVDDGADFNLVSL